MTQLPVMDSRNRYSGEASLPREGISKLAGITLVAYLCQVSFLGPVRYFLSSLHLEALWYLPDILGLTCILVVLLRDLALGSIRILIFLIVLAMYCLEGFGISGSAASVLSTFKALTPLFCGLLIDRRLLVHPLMKKCLFVIWCGACVGVVYSRYFPLPWSSLQFQGVGVAQQFKELQWIAGGDVRLYGFAGDQHSAASSIVALLILLSLSTRKYSLYVLAAVSFLAVYLTTSRTNLLTCLVFVALWSFCRPYVDAGKQGLLRWSLWISFLSPLGVIVITAISLFYSINEVPDALRSLWFRGAITWLSTFDLMERLAPFAMIHGSGLGGFGFGLLQSSQYYYYTPIDNFILFNFVCFGVPYILFYFYQCNRMLTEKEAHRVVVYIVLIVYGFTLRGWSDYLFMILFGYSAVGVFRKRAYRKQVASETDELGNAVIR